MKTFKILLITLSAVLLTGCYTQLEYSQRMNRVTDQQKADRSSQQQEAEYSEYAEEEYVPVYYKDYDYVDRWNDCGCNIYNNYNINTRYSSGYGWHDYRYRPHHFRPYYAWSPYNRWKFNHHYGHRHFGSSFGFSIHWGSSFYDPYFYDPFYYDRYAYGFSPMARNYFIFYGQPGSGYYGGVVGNKGVVDRNRSYRPRSIGTSRVTGTSNRTRNAAVGRQGVTRSKTNTTVRTRSAGTTRSRGTVTRSKSSSSSTGRTRGSSVTRSRGSSSSGSSSSGTRTRSRGGNLQSDTGSTQQGQSSVRSRNVQQDQDQQRQPQVIRYRSLNSATNSSPRKVETRSRIQNRLQGQTAPTVKENSRTRSRSSFFDRMKGIIQQGGKHIINSRTNSSTIRLRSRSSGNRSSVTRSKSSGNRSSVTRSRSSSNNRSKSTSSRSRSSSSSSSGGSDRSRGN